MKKTFALLLVLVMMLALSVTASAAGRLTPDEAKQAALDYVGVDAVNAAFTKLKRDWDDGREVYEIEFYADGTQYEMDIDALTGRVKDFSAEYHDGYGQSASVSGIGYGDAGTAGAVVGTVTVGGWKTADDPTITQDIEQMLSKALDGYQTGSTNLSFTPVTYLGSQVVAGTNHAILCKATGNNGASAWVIVYLYQDLKGNVSVMNIADFDFSFLCTYGLG
ncbi:MAG: PepSY domain-containing protein [Oscillospiraceae bacterium]|nr:PepSY domain-containing protein [Oscillospiraceae bacterium]